MSFFDKGDLKKLASQFFDKLQATAFPSELQRNQRYKNREINKHIMQLRKAVAGYADDVAIVSVCFYAAGAMVPPVLKPLSEDEQRDAIETECAGLRALDVPEEQIQTLIEDMKERIRNPYGVLHL